MSEFRICGGGALNGTIQVRGSKNAATPMLAASLLTTEAVVLDNVPRITDFFRMVELAESVGSAIRWTGEHTLHIETPMPNAGALNTDIVEHLRSSVLFMGALLGRAGSITMPQPGGCTIGARPIDVHLRAFQACGVTVQEEEKNVSLSVPSAVYHQEERVVVLREMSVTATENILIFAAALSGKTVIHGAAVEPHVRLLARMLCAMGANINGIGTHTLTIHGGTLQGTSQRIHADPIEAGTFLILGALAPGSLAVAGVNRHHLARMLVYLEDCGVVLHTDPDTSLLDDETTIFVEKGTLTAQPFETRTWPGIPTDLQAPLCVLASQAYGTTAIHETLFEGRFRHLRELERMGASVTIPDAHHAFITGPTSLYGRNIQSFDLRAGATLLIAALIAEGESVIHNIEQVDRGYEDIDDRLRAIGANIERIH